MIVQLSSLNPLEAKVLGCFIQWLPEADVVLHHPDLPSGKDYSLSCWECWELTMISSCQPCLRCLIQVMPPPRSPHPKNDQMRIWNPGSWLHRRISKRANPVPVGCPRPLLGLHLSSASAQFCYLPVPSTGADLKHSPQTPCTLISISESALQEPNLGNYYEEGD